MTKNALAPSKLSKDITEKVKTETIKSDDIIAAEPPAKASVKAELGHVVSAAVVEKQAEIELSKPKSEAEKLAEKVSDAQIRQYWRAREAERTTPRGEIFDGGGCGRFGAAFADAQCRFQCIRRILALRRGS